MGSPKVDEKKRQQIFKQTFGYFDKKTYEMMTSRFGKLFEFYQQPQIKKIIKEVSGFGTSVNASDMSDEGMYDFFGSLDDYFRITPQHAEILGWEVIGFPIRDSMDMAFTIEADEYEQDRAKTAELPLKSEPERSFPLVDDTQTKSERLVKLNIKEEEQPKSDLMKELEAIENKEIHPTDIPIEEVQFEKPNSVSAFKNIKGTSFTSVVEKLQELEESSEEIKIDVSQGQVALEKFKTSIQRAAVPVPEIENKPEGSNALSQYVGEIYKLVYSKWKSPLGSKFKDVTVAFTIFSKGNINTPVVRKSARDKNLDSIAVSAIIDAAPFPELPEKLKRSNLKINIIFKYVPEKK